MNNDIYSPEITKLFFEQYVKLEQISKDSPQIFNRFYEKHKASFDMFKSTRNILAHNKVGAFKENYPVIVSKYMLEELTKIIGWMTVKAYSKSTKLPEIATASLKTPLHDVIKLMNDKNYSYVPVIENGKVRYVISEKALLSILADNKEGVIYDKTITVGDYHEYFELDENPNEYYSFVGREMLAYDLNDEFSKIRGNKKCGVLFVTQEGKRDEKILGIITLWDIVF